MSILLIFMDGVGIGQNDPSRNPFALTHSLLSRFSNEASEEIPAQFKKKLKNDIGVMEEIVESDSIERLPSFKAIFSKYSDCLRAHEEEYAKESAKRERKAKRTREVFKEIDPKLGVPGVPQSATGQASLLTGINVPKIIKKHLAGLPDQTVREVINRESIFLKLSGRGLKTAFANAFTDMFFRRERPRISATTQSALAGGLKLRLTDDVKSGNALYHDFTNFFLREMGYDLELFSPCKAGKILAKIASENDFTLYEYFITDIMGHKGELREASIEVAKIDLFLRSVLECIDLDHNLVIMTSDHGNLEDILTKTHTLNRVPLLCWGKGSGEFASGVNDIADISRQIVNDI